MESANEEEFHFDRKNYFQRFKHNNDEQKNINKHIRHALEYFLDDLKHDRNKTIERFLNEENINEIFLFIAQLLSSDDERLVKFKLFFKKNFYIHYRICGNSAYIIGSTVEIERGLKQFFSIFDNNQIDIIRIFCQLLTHPDADCVLNATGTLGTIVCRFQDFKFVIV
jgi:hypothetical protein